MDELEDLNTLLNRATNILLHIEDRTDYKNKVISKVINLLDSIERL